GRLGPRLEGAEELLGLDPAGVVLDILTGEEAGQHVRRLPVLLRRVADGLRVPEAAGVPLDRAPDRPGKDALRLGEELFAEPVVTLLRTEVALPRDQLHAPPQTFVLAAERRQEVGGQAEEELR